MAITLIDIFINAFITLLVIANPLAAAAVFTGLMAGYDSNRIKKTSYRAVFVSFGLLVFFALLGEPLLDSLGISIPAFRIAGGMLLFVTAFRMLFGHHEAETLGKMPEVYNDRSDVAVFPMAIPLLAGPGCMTASILLTSKANDVSGGWFAVLVAILAVMGVSLACLLMAGPLQRLIGYSGTNILVRVMGVVLAAMSVQFIADGLRGMNFHFAG